MMNTNALQILESSAKLDQHVASHAYAERVYERVLELIREGYQPAEVRTAVCELHRRARAGHDAVARDAYVEVLDALDAD